MSKLDNALMQEARRIVVIEQRPFSFKDFECFKVNGITYNIGHGTFRNKISNLRKQGKVEIDYNSNITFYTLPGFHFGHTMTGNHMDNSTVIGVTELLDFIESLPLESKSIHDIHMRFSVPDIWTIIASSPKYQSIMNSISKDIKLQPIITEHLKIQTTVHHTDTVSVVIGCSRTPISLEDINGIIRLTNGLVRAEERLSKVLDECGEKIQGGYEKIPIPDHVRWTVTMWHFGRDSKEEYCGEGFSITFGFARDALVRIYTKKKNNNHNFVRSEIQQSPNKTLYEAIQQKINSIN